MNDEPADKVIDRITARVVLLDRDGRVLLFRGSDPSRPEDGFWWFTPGGEIEPGETPESAARREVHEETGHLLRDLGPVVFRRRIRFSFEGVQYQQFEHYFRARAEHTRVDYSGWTDTERRTMHAHHWWTAQELRTTTEKYYPEGLMQLLIDG